jgi:tritrans,polycis-undecaprenyl-diphosphate synthase [geranylgeranyl-diphosphate specific]
MHVGLIPDGNRRYMAKKRIGSLLSSYDMGIGKFYDFLKWCKDLGIDEVTIYALSTENLENRGKKELETLFSVFNRHALDGIKDLQLHERKIRVRICGDLRYLTKKSKNIKAAKEMVSNLRKLEKSTSKYEDFTLNLAIAYGGRAEIISAVKKTISSGRKINTENIEKNLWVKNPVDILIRTSESRISNFLLWQVAYSEIYFVGKLWQEFERKDLVKIVSDFRGRERRYGK